RLWLPFRLGWPLLAVPALHLAAGWLNWTPLYSCGGCQVGLHLSLAHLFLLRDHPQTFALPALLDQAADALLAIILQLAPVCGAEMAPGVVERQRQFSLLLEREMRSRDRQNIGSANLMGNRGPVTTVDDAVVLIDDERHDDTIL